MTPDERSDYIDLQVANTDLQVALKELGTKLQEAQQEVHKCHVKIKFLEGELERRKTGRTRNEVKE